ncbi:MAG: sulfotransferase, partial [Desulfofustis sp.]
AATHLQQGDPAKARRGLEKVAKLVPKSAAVWYNLALSAQHLGQHHKALTEYKKSLELAPDQVEAVINLALSHKSLEQKKEAMKAAKKALDMDPVHPRALNLLGSLYAEEKRYDKAREYLEKSLENDPQNAEVRQNLANAYLESGHTEEAAQVLAPLIANPEVTKEQLELHGQILLDQRNFDEVQPLIKNLKQHYPDDESVLILEMSFCELINDNFSVVDIAQKILNKDPKKARVWTSLGSAYFQLDSTEKAKDSYLRAIEFDPEHPEYRNNIGLAFASLGQKEKAEESYRQSLALNPEYLEAHRNLIAMRKFDSLEDPDVLPLLALWNRDDSSEQMRCKLAFALGKVYDDCGLYDQAFETYKIGNDLKSKEIAMDFDQYYKHIDRIMEVLNTEPATVVTDIESPCRPIFILGMSRSGTTLVEQIISRHPDVTGCGELPCIERAIGRLERNYGETRIYPDDFPEIEKSLYAKETREYIDWVMQLHPITTGYFTDKMPFNFIHIWLIKTLLPDAAIVHCHRHPLDVIVSNYFQLYGSEINFVYDLEILTRYYLRYHRLMRHWHRVFPDDIYKVQYEALVADNEDQTRSLIKGAGLEWDDACLDKSRSNTAVRTASIWQVREGIYTSSKERWRRYEKHLGPAIEILRDAGVLDRECRYLE